MSVPGSHRVFLFTLFKMRKVVVRKRLAGYEINLGVGAIVALDYATPPIIKFLRGCYQKDPDCLGGDVDYLFRVEGTGLSEKDYYWGI